MAYNKIPLLVLLLCFPALLKAQTDPIKNAETQLLKWTDKYPQEKVYLHTDKPYYATGDDIWFKAYITVGPKHELSALGAALNVELIDALDSVKQAIKLPVIAGTAIGDFALSDTLKPGNYRIRAYTQWMRNFDAAYFFDKNITIGSTAAKSVYAQTTYSYSNQNGQQNTTANIIFTDINGTPYAGKEVSYQVVVNGKSLLKSKGITDAKGALVVTFTKPPALNFKSGQITAKIKTDAKTTLTKDIPVNAISGNVDVQFFPESGRLIYGLPSKVAFKAVGANGLGTPISGNITDNNNNEVAKLTTTHLGMGAFMILPAEGKTYKANINFTDGSQHVVNLPLPEERGYVLYINTVTDPDNVIARIFAGETLKGNEINLVAQSGGSIYYAGKNIIKTGVISAKIPKSKFPRGVVQFTLFNAAGEALNEREVFIDKPDDLKLDIVAPQASYKTRDKITLGLTAINNDNKGVISTLSAAVIDNTRVPVNASDETTILSSILLSSDIKGYIEQPNYYFENTDKERTANLDILMLTQGYRRFEWKPLMAGSFTPITFEPEKSLQVSGRVHTGGNKPVVGGKVSLFSTKGGVFYQDTLTDKDGRFAFKNLVFKDSLRFVVQARTDKNKKFVDIDLDNTIPQIVTANPNAPDVCISDTGLSYLQNSKKMYEQQLRSGVGNHNILLKEVVIREKREPLKNSSNLNGAGQADQIIKSDVFEKTACPTVADCLQGRLLGVIFRNGIPYTTRGGGEMQVIVDGIYVDSDYLTSINQYDIGSIEVLRSPGYTAIYGGRASNGLIIINTKRGGEGYTVNRYTPGLITYMPRGFYQARSFYSPQYDAPNVNTALADLRTTIFWKPNILTGDDGKASIEYFNAGSPGIYRVVIEGMDVDGHLGRKVYRYKVE